jgi:hypothetical protein
MKSFRGCWAKTKRHVGNSRSNELVVVGEERALVARRNQVVGEAEGAEGARGRAGIEVDGLGRSAVEVSDLEQPQL